MASLQLRWLIVLSLALAATSLTSVVPPKHDDCHAAASKGSPANVPLILWHGLGDSFDSDGIRSVADLYRDIYPNSPVYLVHIGDDGSADRHATFFGNLTDHLRDVCENLRSTPELANAPAANALGFSQGGQFLRALVQRCSTPPIRNLITFGSQHNGIITFAQCAPDDWWCNTWSGTLKSNTFSSFAQANLVPAQYFRDPADLDSYLEFSNFLADVNNEREVKNDTYKRNIAALRRFVMYTFEDEDVVHPKESSSFAEFNTTTGKATPLRERKIYLDDWLGLRKLDKDGGLIFRDTPGKHMRIEDKALREAFEVYMQPDGDDSKTFPAAGSQQRPLGIGADRASYEMPPNTDDGIERGERLQGGCRKASRWFSIRGFLEGFLGHHARQHDPAWA